MTELVDAILARLPEGVLRTAIVGRRWTAAVVEVQGLRRCGLAATWWLPEDEAAPVSLPIEGSPARALANELRQARGARASLAAATVNALLPTARERWEPDRLEDVIRRLGADRSVVMVGHFPFVDTLRSQVGSLTVLEEHPRPGDLHAGDAPEVLPGAEVVVITGMAFVNRSLADLLRLCSAQARVVVAGPSTPLSPVLFEHGVHRLCGAIVRDEEAVLRAVAAGVGFHGVHQAGVELVTLSADGPA
jgi:uncharacterized protein (DUF4213/DUF364 family)